MDEQETQLRTGANNRIGAKKATLSDQQQLRFELIQLLLDNSESNSYRIVKSDDFIKTVQKLEQYVLGEHAYNFDKTNVKVTIDPLEEAI